MVKENSKLTKRILVILKQDPGQTVKELAERLQMNRNFLAGYLKALENQGYIKSKKIGPAKVYFKKK
jgi:predicted transcriptional regulator